MNILMAVPKYNLSKKKDYNYSIPLGLAYILATMKKAGYSVECFNLNHYDGKVEELLNCKLNKKRYDIVCSGGNSLIYPVIKIICDTVNRHVSHPKMIIGGPIITSEPKLMFDLLKPYVAVIGEGEKTIVELIKAIKLNKHLDKIDGIIFKNSKNEICATKPRDQIKNIGLITFPDLEGIEFCKKIGNSHCNDSWINQVFDYPKTYSILGSRGCPFNCTFCWHDVRYRARSIGNIIKELSFAIEKYDINNIEIYDDCFSANKERLYLFCKKIKKLSKKFKRELKWSCQLLVNTVDKDMLKIMKDAGCNNISYGFESYSSIVLKSMRKPITPQQIDKVLNETLEGGIAIQGNFIFGDIAETKETARETLSYWKKNSQTRQISLGFVQPYPGSELYKYCLRKRIIKDKMDYIQNYMGPDSRFNMTAKMSNKEVEELSVALLDYFRRYFKFITPVYMKKMIPRSRIYEIKIKCPFCNKETVYSNCFVENKFTYGFHIICRQCNMRSVLVGPIKKIAYKNYTITRKLRNSYIHLRKQFKKKTI